MSAREVSTAIGLSSVPSARYGPSGWAGPSSASPARSSRAAPAELIVPSTADRRVVAIGSVLEPRHGQPRGLAAAARPADRAGRCRDRDRAERAEEDEDRDDDRQQALATREPGSDRVHRPGPEPEPRRDALALGQAMGAVGEDGRRRGRVEGLDASDRRTREPRAPVSEGADREKRGVSAVRSSTSQDVADADRRVLQYGLLQGGRTSRVGTPGAAVRSGARYRAGGLFSRGRSDCCVGLSRCRGQTYHPRVAAGKPAGAVEPADRCRRATGNRARRRGSSSARPGTGRCCRSSTAG